MYLLSVMYRDGDNWKDTYDVLVNEKEYPKIKELKVDSSITMGEFGTQTTKEFFGGDNHEQSYNPEYDHNILEVVAINKV